jgi:hypothetical protein
MDRRIPTSRPRALTGALATFFSLVIAIGSTPMAAVGSGAALVAVPAAPALPPGLRAELAIGDQGSAGLAAGAPGASVAGVTAAAVSDGARLEAAPPRIRGTTASDAKPQSKPARTASAPQPYKGTNHVWSAALALNRSVSAFSCSRSRPPDNLIYRWGCAGQNNVYLFAHAGGPFKRLHDLYVRGGLKRGMTVTYAGPSGQVHRYRVAWWKVVLPTNGAFAYAALSRPAMTLQTCVGLHDRYRLVVRLYQSD